MCKVQGGCRAQGEGYREQGVGCGVWGSVRYKGSRLGQGFGGWGSGFTAF